jgi:hypothetical protein
MAVPLLLGVVVVKRAFVEGVEVSGVGGAIPTVSKSSPAVKMLHPLPVSG